MRKNQKDATLTFITNDKDNFWQAIYAWSQWLVWWTESHEIEESNLQSFSNVLRNSFIGFNFIHLSSSFYSLDFRMFLSLFLFYLHWHTVYILADLPFKLAPGASLQRSPWCATRASTLREKVPRSWRINNEIFEAMTLSPPCDDFNPFSTPLATLMER